MSCIAGVKIFDRIQPQAGSPFAQELEETMALKIVLSVGVDSWMLAAHRVEWRSAGFIVLPVITMGEAFEHFRLGDFDLVLLGHSLPVESKERLTFLIRSCGSRTPVVSIADTAGDCDSFATATIRNDGNALLEGMGELLAKASKPLLVRMPLPESA
jgi:hypothetical protein